MKQTRELLKQLEMKYSSIEYYYVIIDKIEENIESNPDICIESCKSLIEGLCKFILNQFGKFSVLQESTFNLAKSLRSALEELAEKSASMDGDFLIPITTFVRIICEIRNQRGDISHGKFSPKPKVSSIQLANYITGFTNNTCFYILSCFAELEKEKKLFYEDPQYEDFNEFLDLNYPLENVLYSKALFEQDQLAYQLQFEDYKLNEDLADLYAKNHHHEDC